MKLKNAIYTLLLALFVVFIVQNIEIVSVSFLIWSFELPRSLMLLLSFSLGTALGLLLRSRRKAH